HHHHCGYVGGGSALCCVRGVSRRAGIAALLWTILLRQLLSGKFIGYFDEFFDQGTGDALATTDRSSDLYPKSHRCWFRIIRQQLDVLPAVARCQSDSW